MKQWNDLKKMLRLHKKDSVLFSGSFVDSQIRDPRKKPLLLLQPFLFLFFFSLLFPACLLGFLFICLFVSWRVFVFLCFLLFHGGFFLFWLTLFVWGFSLVLVLVFWGRLFAVAGWLKMISLVLFVYFCFASLFLICFLVEVGTLVLN